MLSQLSRFEDALPLWQKLPPLDVLRSDTRYLLACAVRTERHGIVLDVCNSLRAAGVDDPELFQTQMAMLERYSPEKGLELLQAEALKHPEDRAMQLLSSFLDFCVVLMNSFSSTIGLKNSNSASRRTCKNCSTC